MTRREGPSSIFLVLFLVGVTLSMGGGAIAASQSELIIYQHEPTSSAPFKWPEGGLAQSFERYWKAFRDGDKAFCYNAEAPHFRFLFSEATYGAYWGVATKLPVDHVEVLSLEQKSPYFVEVPMWLVKKDAQGQTVRVGVKDRWVKVSGQWYHVLRDPIVFPGS